MEKMMLIFSFHFSTKKNYMKKKCAFLSLLAFLLVNTTLLSQNLTYTPDHITPGDEVQINYHPQGTPLEGLETVLVDVYLFENDQVVAHEIPVSYQNGSFNGTFNVPKNTTAMLFSFTNEDMSEKDNNEKKGYKVLCYQADRKTPVVGAYATKALMVSQYAWLTDIDGGTEKAVKLFKKEFELHPTSKENALYQKHYASYGINAKDEEITSQAKAKMEAIMEESKPSEEAISYAYNVSRSLKLKDQYNAIQEQYLNAYPKSKFAATQTYYKIRRMKDIGDVLTAYDSFKNNFSHLESFAGYNNDIMSLLARLYNKKEDHENYNKYLGMIDDKVIKAGSLNSKAWIMSGESLDGKAINPEEGQALSMQSLKLIKEEMQVMASKPKMVTNRQYQRNLNNSYAMYADTYALLAYKNNQPKEALKYQQIACDNDDFTDGEMAERYSVFYKMVHGEKATEHFIADMIAEGKATDKMKEEHKKLYLKNNTVESAYEKYVLELEKAAHAKLRAEVEEMLINTPAPAFELLTLEGKPVSLESLQGKVVVVDFWATWCGPCKASFPGMQDAVNKYKESEDVEFVFIDTWESGKDIKKKVADFISSNNYTFNVLMDLENKTVVDFGVSGVPTKFVLDKNGQIRFKSIGYSGNNEAMVEELSMVIEILGGTLPTPVTGAP